MQARRVQEEKLSGGAGRLERLPARRARIWAWMGMALLSASCGVRGEMQFDVFLGYENHVREAAWFPLACEIFHDGPTFEGVVEVFPTGLGANQVQRLPVELPTNTRKRLVAPVFASGTRLGQWTVRLVDRAGKLRHEEQSVTPRYAAWESVLFGALSRDFTGAPVFLDAGNQGVRPEASAFVVRMQVAQFPDHALALDGLDALYLSSAKAIDLTPGQVAALGSWVQNGGHLVVAVQEGADLRAAAWLRDLLPCAVEGTVSRGLQESLGTWVSSERSGEAAGALRTAGVLGRGTPGGRAIAPLGEGDLAVAVATVREGRALLVQDSLPLIVEGRRGRGWVTALLFDPEREPFRSWKARGQFWQKLIGVPPGLISGETPSAYGGISLDGVMGALLDSRQGRRLPVGWLLLLLTVYLVVIGPFDQITLKKLNRQTWTWVTFPAYVAAFSVLIYWLGYKLRAGETEWNELHFVDVPGRGDAVEWRGRTYISVYGSANETVPLESRQPVAALRGEFLDIYGGGNSSSAMTVTQSGNRYEARAFVPVWSSVLFLDEWFRTGPAPLAVSVTRSGEQWAITIENRTGRGLEEAVLVIEEMAYDVGAIPAGGKALTVERKKGWPLRSFVMERGSTFLMKAQRRRNALGDDEAWRLSNPVWTSMASSFPSFFGWGNAQQRGLIFPSGFDLRASARGDSAVLLAFGRGHAPVEAIRRFDPPRKSQHTLYRVALRIADTAAVQ